MLELLIRHASSYPLENDLEPLSCVKQGHPHFLRTICHRSRLLVNLRGLLLACFLLELG